MLSLRVLPQTQVEIFCYALSASDGSEWRARIEREAEHFADVSAWGVPDIAGRISADGIHIAVNLNGYTKVGCCRSPGFEVFSENALALQSCCLRAAVRWMWQMDLKDVWQLPVHLEDVYPNTSAATAGRVVP